MKLREFRAWHPLKVKAKDEKPPININEITEHQARCLQAVSNGEATPDEQKAALEAVMWVCGVDDMEFLPDNMGGERDSAFKSGRRHVGMQLRKVVNLPLTLLIGENK